MTRCAKATGAGITASHLLMELLANRLVKQLAIRLGNQKTVARLLCSDPFALAEVRL